MAECAFSKKAEQDLINIYLYTAREFGVAQAEAYVGALRARCFRVAEMPRIGRPADKLSPGLRRIEHERQVLFYREQASGIRIVRILHQMMDTKRHL